MIDPAIFALCDKHLTSKQYETWRLIHVEGLSLRAAALHLDLARVSVTDRYDNACRNLRRAGVRFTPDGRPYLEEQTPSES